MGAGYIAGNVPEEARNRIKKGSLQGRRQVFFERQVNRNRYKRGALLAKEVAPEGE